MNDNNIDNNIDNEIVIPANHDEIMELLGAYALDSVEVDERELVEAHLPTCPRCAAEVADHREVAAMLAHTGAPAPEGIWTKIADSLEETPPALRLPLSGMPVSVDSTPTETHDETPVAEVASLDASRRRRDQREGERRRVPVWQQPLGIAAAAVLLVIGLVAAVLVSGAGDTDPASQVVAQPTLVDVARRTLNDPASTKVSLASDDGDLVVSAAVSPDGSGYLLGTTLPALSEEETYQLWAVSDRAVISLGVLGSSPDVVAFRVEAGVNALAITREVAGGVPSSANAPLVVGTLA